MDDEPLEFCSRGIVLVSRKGVYIKTPPKLDPEPSYHSQAPEMRDQRLTKPTTSDQLQAGRAVVLRSIGESNAAAELFALLSSAIVISPPKKCAAIQSQGIKL